MSDPGLSYRLRQRSRRAGLMIGLSMLLTIAVCAMGFTVIYSALDDFTSDFISRNDDTPTPGPQLAQNTSNQQTTAQNIGQDSSQPATNDEGNSDEENQVVAAAPTPTPTPEPESDAEASGDEDDEDGFEPDYQLRGVTVNLRSGPSTSTDIVTALPPSTPLEYLNEDEPTDNPNDGERWMRFATEEGLEGWIREIDVTEYEP